MVLSNEQAELFYELWISLLDFVNRKYRICKELYGMESPKGLPTDVIAVIAQKLWEDVAVIDEYLAYKSKKMSPEHIDIVRGWKKAVRGKFVVERHQKNGSILISAENEGTVYREVGIYSSWRELLERFPMPQIVETSLIPFQGVIIHDSVVMPYGVCLGKNMADEAKQMYLTAKVEKKIVERIE